MSEIDLGGGCDAELINRGVLIIDGEFGTALLPPEQMDALCKWWLEQREQQAIENLLSDIISDLRKEQP